MSQGGSGDEGEAEPEKKPKDKKAKKGAVSWRNKLPHACADVQRLHCRAVHMIVSHDSVSYWCSFYRQGQAGARPRRQGAAAEDVCSGPRCARGGAAVCEQLLPFTTHCSCLPTMT